MPKEAVAEWMLELVTSSQRAASIVGDLLEEASNRHVLWFWFSSLKIFASHLLQDLRNHWLRIIWLGFSEFAIYAIGAVFIVGEIIEGKSFLRPYASITQYLLFGFPILLGWHIARRSHGLELASGLSLSSVFWIYKIVEMLPMFWVPVEKLPMSLQGNHFTMLMHSMLLMTPFNTLIILGVLFCRFRTNARFRKLQLS
jgi:hypothetical protein